MKDIQSILRISAKDFKKNTKKEKENMSGSVIIYDSKNSPDSPNLRAFKVKFENGAYTKWHRHCGVQILIGEEGLGFVEQSDKVPQAIMCGDQIYIPAGVWHRHGAKEGQTMMHLAITIGETKWDENDLCK